MKIQTHGFRIGSGEQDIFKGKVKEQTALLSQIAKHGVKVHRVVIITARPKGGFRSEDIG